MKGEIKTAEKKTTSEYKRKSTGGIAKMSRREEDTKNRSSTTAENGLQWSKPASAQRKPRRMDNKHDRTVYCFQEMHFNPYIIQHTCWRGDIIFCINSPEDGRGSAATRTTKENLLQEQMMEHYTHDVTDPPVHCRKDNSCTHPAGHPMCTERALTESKGETNSPTMTTAHHFPQCTEHIERRLIRK